jgi:Mitochondrial carrier protein
MIQGKIYKTGAKLQDKLIDVSAAATAKCISIFLTNPFYLLKTRAESGQLTDTQNLWSHIKQIHKSNGIRGFYYGFWATIIRDVPYQSIQFAIYKTLGEAMNAFETNSSKPGDLARKSKGWSYRKVN